MPSDPNRPLIIPVFIPHQGCPHRCLFCDQAQITADPHRQRFNPNLLQQYIQPYLLSRNAQRKPIIVAFYGGNFLGLPENYRGQLLTAAQNLIEKGLVDTIRFSTRPDTIDAKRLATLQPFTVSTVELGVQSMHDEVLTLAHRGHGAQDTVDAVGLLKKENHTIGLQMMVGLPGDNEARSEATARQLIELEPDFVRIYPTVVLKGSPLARLYRQKRYQPWSLERAVQQTKRLLVLFSRHHIPIIRMGLQAVSGLESSILAGPYHPAFGHLVHSALFLDRACTLIDNHASQHGQITLKVHSADLSKARGLKNANIEILKTRFQIDKLDIQTDPTLPPGQLVLDTHMVPIRK